MNDQHDLNCLNIKELELLAHERMDKQTRDYYNEGADSGSTLREKCVSISKLASAHILIMLSITAYEKYRIRPRVCPRSIMFSFTKLKPTMVTSSKREDA